MVHRGMITLVSEISGLLSARGEALASVRSARGQNDRVDALTLLCREVLRASTLRIIGGDARFWDGTVYRSVTPGEVCSVLGNVLVDMGVSPVDVRRMGDMPLSVIGERTLMRDSSLVAFTNGVLDLRSLSLSPFSPSLPVTESLPYPYDPEARCPVWESFLSSVLPDPSVRDVLGEFFGCCYLDRSALSVEKFAILIGEGANGKSVIRDVITSAMGQGNVSAFDAAQLTRPELQPYLNGKRVNFASDMAATAAFDSALKALASGQEVVGRRIYGEPETVKAPPIVFSMNRLPPFRDTSDAFFRRVLLFRFPVVVPEGERDATLASRIRSSELPGVFNWIMRGRGSLLSRGGVFSPSASMDRELSILRGSVSDASFPVRAWLEGRGYSVSPAYDGQPSVLVSQNEIDLGLRGSVSRHMITAELRRFGVATFRSKELFYRVYRKNG